MKQKVLLTLVALMAALTALAQQEYDIGIGGIIYRINGEVAIVTGNYAPSENLTIPEAVYIDFEERSYPVTSIESNAFYRCKALKSLAIGHEVTSIGDYAFSECTNLTSLTIGNSVTSIGEYAFNFCSALTSLTIGNSVTAIGSRAFCACSGLTSVRIPDSVTSIGSGAFSGCTGLADVTIGNSVTSIGDAAFNGCSALTSVVIPNSVTSIGELAFCRSTSLTNVTIGNSVASIARGAFDGCNLKSLTIPKSVTSIGSRAFTSNAFLMTITVENGNPVYDSRDNCNAIIETSSNKLIAGCSNTVIPNTVTTIGDYAFINELYSYVRIPSSVTSIGEDAFGGCWIRSVICLAVTPPVIDSHLFINGSTNVGSPLCVPMASVSAYREAVGWNFFKNIYGLGDMNGDERLSISDVTGLINQLLQGGEDIPAYCDVNGDGKFNVSDVTALIEILLYSD